MLKTKNMLAVCAAMGVFLLPAGSKAEDATQPINNNPNVIQHYQTYQPVPGNDQLYVLPPQYHGKTYPDEQEGEIGYYGTQKSSKADNPNPTNYYYYYY
jgi:hypothetical protein